MTFGDLQFDYARYLEDPRLRVENKQRINLSDRAYAVLLNDSDAFRAEDSTKKQRSGPASYIINHIFRCFRETAHSSVALACQNRKVELEKALAPVQPAAAREHAIQLLMEEYQTQLAEELGRRGEKGHGFSFRIDIENLSYLASEDSQRERRFYSDRVGDYIKAVLEEYAELPPVERERIYYRNILDEIQLAIAQRTMLKLTMRTVSKGRNGTANNILYVKPLGVQQDSEGLYNYLVGINATVKGGPWAPGAIRLTSIKDAHYLKQAAAVTKEERKFIKNEIRRNGVQYLSDSGSAGIVKVRFTPEGERQYYRILHLRPLYTTHPEPLVYEFSCTRFQAETYFFRYGHNVKILEPKNLADKFMRRYQSAAKQYET